MNTARVLLRKTFIGYFMSSKEWGGKARTHVGRFVSPQGKRRRIYSSAIATPIRDWRERTNKTWQSRKEDVVT